MNLGAIKMKGYSAFPKAQALLVFHQISRVISYHMDHTYIETLSIYEDTEAAV